MKLSGSVIYFNLRFLQFWEDSLVHWTHSFFVASSYTGIWNLARWNVSQEIAAILGQNVNGQKEMAVLY